MPNKIVDENNGDGDDDDDDDNDNDLSGSSRVYMCTMCTHNVHVYSVLFCFSLVCLYPIDWIDTRDKRVCVWKIKRNKDKVARMLHTHTNTQMKAKRNIGRESTQKFVHTLVCLYRFHFSCNAD